MPRVVDHAERRVEIVEAAVRIMSRAGVGALTLRSLADELNGSITLVTHFVATRADLFEAIIDEFVAGYDEEVASLDHGDDPLERLATVVRWLLPLSEEDLQREAGRIALHAMREQPSVEHFFEIVDRRIREVITTRIRPLVNDDDVAQTVDYIRALSTGLTLSALEHRDHWTPSRQLEIMELGLRSLGLAVSLRE